MTDTQLFEFRKLMYDYGRDGDYSNNMLEVAISYCRQPRVVTPKFAEKLRRMNELADKCIKEEEEKGNITTIEVNWNNSPG